MFLCYVWGFKSHNKNRIFSEEFFCFQFGWNLVGIYNSQIPATIPNFSWIAADFFWFEIFTLDVSVICCQFVVQGSFSVLSLQILWLNLFRLSKWPSKSSSIYLYKRCASHPSEGQNNYKHLFIKLKHWPLNEIKH